ncbi:MAG: helix-turn-helix domain-containing protein [Desulfobulbus sp.]|nr:helix-turn-helix domain-containing protein [Desulfobulbus sp.]
MDQLKKKRISSGIEQLDSLLGDLYIGDNVLWYEDAGSFSSAFCFQFIRQSLAARKPVVYVSFDRSPKNVVTFLGPLAEKQNLTILDCFTNGKGDSSEVFNKFYEKDGAQWPYQVIRVNDPANPTQVGEAIYGLHGNLSGDIGFIMDSLTGMQDLWGGEEQVTKFYARTCPRLYELDTIAYWIVEKSAHSNRLKANINKIAQVAIDLSVKNGKSILKILKAEKRTSPSINEAQVFTCEQGEIAFELPRGLPGRFDLGGRIKAVRLKQGLSQKDLAERTGVTPSSISQIEKNQIYPSIPALFRLAESLAVGVTTFFEGLTPSQNGCVFHNYEGVGVFLEKTCKGTVTGQRLLPPDICDTTADPYLLRIEPGRKLAGHFFNHKGEEVGYLLHGHLTLWVDGQNQEAGPGDLIYLRKEVPQQWHNSGDTVAELLWFRLRS